MGTQQHKARGTRSMELASFLQAHEDEILGGWQERLARARPQARVGRRELAARLAELRRAASGAFTPTPVPAAPDPTRSPLLTAALLPAEEASGPELVREYELLHETLVDQAAALGAPFGSEELVVLTKHILTALASRTAEAAAANARRVEDRLLERYAYLAHDLRLPLHGATLAVELLRRHAEAGPPRALALLDGALAELNAHIEDTLSLMRLRSPLELERQELHAGALLDSVVERCRSVARVRNVELACEAPTTLGLVGDERMLRSAIGNMVSAAVKHSRRGSRVMLRATNAEPGVRFEVVDRCGGIPGLADCERLLRAGEPTRFGSSLGLRIALHAIELHGGKLELQEMPGEGCRFVAALPLSPPRGQVRATGDLL